jgi:hypothetical protein
MFSPQKNVTKITTKLEMKWSLEHCLNTVTKMFFFRVISVNDKKYITSMIILFSIFGTV